jgi:hypothetical protein
MRSEARTRRDGKRQGLLMLFAVVFCMAPTVGDIGSCGQSAADLDPTTFFSLKARYDCDRCGECGLEGSLCEAACQSPVPTEFPAGCRPLVHDGEVCLNALLYASCEDYATYVNPADPRAPSECQFCPLR